MEPTPPFPDPLTELVAELKIGRAPLLAWVVRWAPDGCLKAAWIATSDPDAMRFVLNDKRIGRVVYPKNLLGLRLSPSANVGLKIMAASMIDAIFAPTKVPLMAYATAYMMPAAMNEAAKDRVENVRRIRACNPKLPTLQELLARLKIGVQ